MNANPESHSCKGAHRAGDWAGGLLPRSPGSTTEPTSRDTREHTQPTEVLVGTEELLFPQGLVRVTRLEMGLSLPDPVECSETIAPETILPRETLLQSSTLTFSDILIPNMEGSQLQVPRDTDRQPRAGIPPKPAEDDTKGQSGPQTQLFSAPKQDVVVYPCSQGCDLPR